MATLTPRLVVRPIEQRDTTTIMHWVNKWRRVHWCISPAEVEKKVAIQPGFLAEDSSGLRGFMLTEFQPAGHLLIIGVALRDTWSIRAYLRHLLPPLEKLMQTESATGIMHIGGTDWFVNGVVEYGFTSKGWIVNLERHSEVSLPPFTLPVAHIRPATKADVSAIHEIDCLTFDVMWHKARPYFEDALSPPHNLLTAVLNRRVVGYIWSERYQNRVHITRLVVHPDYQGRQIGQQLLHYMLTSMLANGATRFSTNTLTDNQAALKLYQQFKFDYTELNLPILWCDASALQAEKKIAAI
ncbi:GNAT family N-acetyltransferase [Anaerolineales bacterium HSG6]|nr:GNAT family N-acetyltransferase [Anaerolineales bacterium HSG6]MDM8529659.1 GNAT family N-acetyltransferase [Anaerolineales bacterium HSG25]